jgi:hypothetical protein
MRKIFLIAFISCCVLTTAAQEILIEVSAGKYDGIDKLVQVRLPKPLPGDPGYQLTNRKTGRVLPAQLLNAATLVFVAEEGNNTYTLKRSTRKFTSGITVQKQDNGLLVKVQNKPLFFYHTKEAMPPADSPAYYRRSGFIHPLYSPTGSILTDDFPAGHTHQHGVFMAWVNTVFRGQKLDFWNQHQKTGTVAHAEVLGIEEGPVFTRIKTKLRHLSLVHGPVLEEIWTITVYPFANNFLFDLESEQVNITGDTLFLNQYHYGGLAFRGSKEWNRHDTAHFKNDWQIITSEGKDNKSANATHARWVDASGILNGQLSGATVFGHPSNFRYPQSIRLHPDMPYWAFAPVVDGAFTLPPDKPYKSRFRYFVHAGAANAESIENVNSNWIEPLNGVIKSLSH